MTTENLKISIKTEARSVEFVMTFDSEFMPDRHMRLLLERDGHIEPEVVHLMTRVVREGDTVIDGGANVGYFTNLLSQLVGPKGLVFAVEPTPVNIWKLERNLANNATKNVRVVKSPLYSNVEELEFFLTPDSGLNSITRIPEGLGSMRTVATTIDDILMDEKPRLIKLDVEGAEGFALQGADTALGSGCPYVVCEMNEEALKRSNWDRDRIRDFMRASGYEMFVLHPQGILPTLIPRNTRLVSKIQNLMVLFSTAENVGLAWPEAQLGP